MAGRRSSRPRNGSRRSRPRQPRICTCGSRGTRARGEPEDAGARVLAELHQLAARDPDVIEMLRLFGEQVIKKEDIVRETGRNTKRYQATRKRMLRLVLQLPYDVREAAMARA